MLKAATHTKCFTVPPAFHYRGVLITCSNNSLDTPCFGQEGGAHGVIGDASRGNSDDYHGPWWQWGLDEGGRVEPPLDDDNNDTHSVGVAIDYTSQEVVPISKWLRVGRYFLVLFLTSPNNFHIADFLLDQ